MQRRVICADTGIAYHRTMTCPRRSEYFIPGTAPAQALASHAGDQLWYDVFSVARSTCIAWGAVESFIYYGQLRRRGRLGLAPPLVVNRFFMWGLGLSAMTLLMASTLLARAVDVDPAAFGWVLIESCVGMLGATTLWLTFFPTPFYRRMLASSPE